MSSYFVNPYVFAAAAGGPTTENMVWNSADKAAGIILLDSDKEAIHETLTSDYVRATKGISTGKYCWAILVDSTATWRTGISLASFNLDSDGLGAGTSSVSISNTGVVTYNGGTLADYTDYAQGDYVLVAFDANAGDIWFGRNTTWNGDPSAGTGAIKSDVASNTWYPTFGSSGTASTAKVTIVPFPAAARPTGFTTLQPTASVDNKHWESVYYQGLSTSSPTWNGYNLRQVITAAQLVDRTAAKMRVRLKGGPSENAQVSAAHIGYQAGAGDAYDMDGTQVALNVGGTNAFTITASTLTTSDEITYAYDGSKGLVLAFHFNSATADVVAAVAVLGYTHYYKTAAAETGTSNVSTYTASSGQIRFVQDIQVYVDD